MSAASMAHTASCASRTAPVVGKSTKAKTTKAVRAVRASATNEVRASANASVVTRRERVERVG